ncbi:uL15m family ribosomal protein [[Eubacterium] cellulosolvens]
MAARDKKFLGSRTHGRGKKAGRGAGKRGGRGNAGLHKHKYIKTVKYLPNHFGRHGFTRPQTVVGRKITINLFAVDEKLDELIKEGKVKKVKNNYELNLNELGFDKLLGSGVITKPVNITISEATEKAVSKIKEAGGKVNIIENE